MRDFESIHAERSAGKTYEITEPPLHTNSGCRFSYKKKVDITTYEEVMRKERAANSEIKLNLGEKLIFKKDKTK